MENIIEVEDKDLMEDMSIKVKLKVEDLGQKAITDGDFKIENITYWEDNHLVDN